jgi:5-methylcytosine-specific restriction endonuclease McrA
MNWITQKKRLAIYLRDGCACVYCGASVEEGTQLTLDHLKPHTKGGTNDAYNLVTCCKPCNDSRGARAVALFARVVAAYRGVAAEAVLKHIRRTVGRSLVPHLDRAQKLLDLRGSCYRVLASREFV